MNQLMITAAILCVSSTVIYLINKYLRKKEDENTISEISIFVMVLTSALLLVLIVLKIADICSARKYDISFLSKDGKECKFEQVDHFEKNGKSITFKHGNKTYFYDVVWIEYE